MSLRSEFGCYRDGLLQGAKRAADYRATVPVDYPDHLARRGSNYRVRHPEIDM